MIIHNSPRKAYTLIELLVVISITSLIFSIGFVNFREFSRRQALTSQTRSISADLRLSQALALAGKKPDGCTGVLDGYLFSIGTDKASYEITALCNTVPVLIKNSSLPDTFSLQTTGVSSVIFKVLGQGTDLDSSIEFVLTQDVGQSSQSVIIVSPSGEITTANQPSQPIN